MDWKQELFKRLDVLAEKLGVTAQYLWMILVKQGRVEAYTDLLWAALWAFAFVVLGFLLLRYEIPLAKKDDGNAPLVLFGGVATLGCAVASITMVAESITGLVNPEYFAFHKLMELIGK
jgi:hypothetical protein